MRLKLSLERAALIAAVDGLIADGRGAPAPLRITARIAGWGDGAAASDRPDRRWVLQLPPLQAPIGQGAGGAVLVAIGDAAVSAALDAGPTAPAAIPPIRVEIDPDDAERPITFDGLKIALQRWPLGRAGTVEIASEATIGDERIAEPTIVLTPSIDRKQGLTRQAQSLLPFRALQNRLAELARARDLSSARADISLRIVFSTAGGAFLAVEAPVEIRRCTHRLPICIDLGASAISVWSGQPHAPGGAFDLRPLAIGSWLATNVDPEHGEALSRTARPRS